jgi:hypothetical protein
MDSETTPTEMGRLIDKAEAFQQKVSVPIRKTLPAPHAGVGRMTLDQGDVPLISKELGSTMVPTMVIPYPKDAGLVAVKAGDIVMTRPMYDFLVRTFSVLPHVAPDELKFVCEQLVKDLQELVK